MSDVTTPTVAAEAAGGPVLSPEAIAAVLEEFRGWLEQAAEAGELPAVPAEERPPVDLHALLSHFVALRHEVIEGLSKATAGNQIVVQFDLNLDGMLKVSAREKATGLQKHIVIQNALARFEREERAAARARLDRLWHGEPAASEFWEEGPRLIGDDTGELALVPAAADSHRDSIQARALVEKAERLLPQACSEDRVELEKLMQRIRSHVEQRQWEQTRAACNELTDILFYLEDA